MPLEPTPSSSGEDGTTSLPLSAMCDRVVQHKDVVAAMISEFEASTKKAIAHIDKYMKRGADTTAISPEQKIDDFKRAAAEFNTSAKAVIKQMKQLSVDVTETSQRLGEQRETIQQRLQDKVKSAPPTDVAAAQPTGAKSDDVAVVAPPAPQIAQAATDDHSVVRSERDAMETKYRKDLEDAHQRIQQLETEVQALSSGHTEQQKMNEAQAVAAQQEAHARIAEVVSERDQLIEKLSTHQSQLEQMDNAFRNVQDTFFRERDALNRAVRSLQDELVVKEREKDEIWREVQQKEDLVMEAKKEQEAALMDKRSVEQRLEFAEKKREGDFVAFEQATRNHERDIHEWQSKYSDAMLLASRLREEKAQLQNRVVDDHLREHIRVLQNENNQLREERVKHLQSSARDPNVFKTLTSALQDSIDALNRDKDALREEISALVSRIDEKDRQLHEEQTRHAEGVAHVNRQNQALEQRVRCFEAMEAELKRRLVPDEMIQQLVASSRRRGAGSSSGRQVGDDPHVSSEDDSAVDLNSNAEGRDPRRRCGSSGPVVEHVIETWERSVQVDDLDRMHLERDVIRLRADNQELADDVARLQQSDQQQRGALHDKLIEQMKGFERQVDGLERESKLRAFKVAKLQQSNDSLDESCRTLQRELDLARNALAASEHTQQDMQKRYLSIEMEKDALDSKVKVLRREIEELHQQASDSALSKQLALEQQQRGQQQQRIASPSLSSSVHVGPAVVPRIQLGSNPSSNPLSGRGESQASDPSTSSVDGSGRRHPHASSAATSAKQDAIRKLDQFMLDLHQQTVNLDNEEQRARNDADADDAKRTQRIAYLEAARPFWEKERRQRGPNGEPPTAMLQQIDQELFDLQKQQIQASKDLQDMYLTISRKREQVLSATSKIIEKRNALMKQ